MKREHPSTQAASSRETGTFLMNPLIRMIDSGSWKTVSAMTTLHRELIIWRFRKISKSGTSIRAPGMNCEQSSASMNAPLILKSNRARAYPPARATRVVAISVATPTIMLFWKKTAKLRSFQTLAKCSPVIGHGTSAVEPAGRRANSSIQ